MNKTWEELATGPQELAPVFTPYEGWEADLVWTKSSGYEGDDWEDARNRAYIAAQWRLKQAITLKSIIGV